MDYSCKLLVIHSDECYQQRGDGEIGSGKLLLMHIYLVNSYSDIANGYPIDNGY